MVTIFVVPLFSALAAGGHLLVPLAAAVLLAWAVYSTRKENGMAVPR